MNNYKHVYEKCEERASKVYILWSGDTDAHQELTMEYLSAVDTPREVVDYLEQEGILGVTKGDLWVYYRHFNKEACQLPICLIRAIHHLCLNPVGATYYHYDSEGRLREITMDITRGGAGYRRHLEYAYNFKGNLVDILEYRLVDR